MKEEEATKTFIGEADAETIAKWKAQNGEIFSAKVGNSICYLKKPSRTVISAMTSIQNDAVKAAEFLLNNCWLGGDDNIKKEDDLFFGVIQVLNQLVVIKSAELEKL